MRYSVTRGFNDECADLLAVYAGDAYEGVWEGDTFVRAEVLLQAPTRALAPESAEAAKARPWFYTGSPFGAEIMALARSRGLVE